MAANSKSLEHLKQYQFSKERPGNKLGRTEARNKISTALMNELARAFDEHGAEVIRIALIEKPVEFLKIIASLMPQRLEGVAGEGGLVIKLVRFGGDEAEQAQPAVVEAENKRPVINTMVGHPFPPKPFP